MSKFQITKDYTTRVKRFNISGRRIEFKINSPPENKEPISWIKSSIEDIVKYAMQEINPSDQVGITFCGESFKDRGGPGWMNFKTASTVKVQDIWEMIANIFQSNSQGNFVLLVSFILCIFIFLFSF